MDCSTCRLSVLLIFGAFFVFPKAALSQSVTGQEYEVKVGFIYNFINYVTWPEGIFADNSEPLILCLISDNPNSDVIFKLNGKSVQGRKINVIAYSGVSCVTQSHVMFFATQDKAVIQKVLNMAHGLGILTIGEVDGFTSLGGSVNFFEESNHLRFQVNINAVKHEGLKMRSQLLGSAQIVIEGDD